MKIKNNTRILNKVKDIAFTIFNKLENNNNADFFTNGEERFLDSFFSTSNDELVIFDIGANVGKYSEIIINKLTNRKRKFILHVFEPSKASFNVLENKFGNNPSIKLNCFGVSNSNGTANIYFDTAKSSFASMYKRNLEEENVYLTNSEEIKLCRLDSYIAENNISKIDFLKIDVEGHELFAFEGLGKFLNNSFIKAIQFEYGGANLDSHTSLFQLYQILQKAGFDIFKIKRNYLEKRQYETKMDNFQYSNYAAISKTFLHNFDF